MNKLLKKFISIGIVFSVCTSIFSGCTNKNNGKVTIEVLHYKREATEILDKLAKDFEDQNPDIHVKISSPSNDVITILKTRLIKNDAPDIVGIGGDRAYADFVDADVIEDISDFEGVSKVKDIYLQMAKDLELIPKEGIYSIPFAANANGVLYNKEIFEKYNWEIPQTWDEFISLLEQVKSQEVTPICFTLKDSWTDLAAWNSIDACINSPDLFQRVNSGETTFKESYSQTSDKIYQLLQYGQNDIFAFGYNDGCTSFANGESAMFLQGNWAIPQIMTVNPEMKIGIFAMPGTNEKDKNVLTSGVDLLFSVMKGTKHREESLRFLDFITEYESMSKYLDDQKAVSCIEGDFEYQDSIKEVKNYFDEGKLQDFPDHHYPAEMPAKDMIQGFLLDGNKEVFLNKFDEQWIKTNRDIIAKVEKMNEN